MKGMQKDVTRHCLDEKTEDSMPLFDTNLNYKQVIL